MTDDERQEAQARLAKLKAKATARRGQAGFAQNLIDLDAEIARLEGLLAE